MYAYSYMYPLTKKKKKGGIMHNVHHPHTKPSRQLLVVETI